MYVMVNSKQKSSITGNKRLAFSILVFLILVNSPLVVLSTAVYDNVPRRKDKNTTVSHNKELNSPSLEVLFYAFSHVYIKSFKFLIFTGREN